MRALPQHEAAEPLLARRTDHEIEVRLAAGVEMVGDVLDVENGRNLLERCTPRRVLLEQTADRVRDLPSPAVPDRDVDEQSGLLTGRLVGLLEHPDRRVA